MFDISIWELFIVVVAGIIFIKPEDLPEILRQCGKFYRKMKKMMHEFTSILEEEEQTIKPRNKILGLDGKLHDAYDVEEVFPERKSEPKNDDQQ